jgi:hypothetical protein
MSKEKKKVKILDGLSNIVTNWVSEDLDERELNPRPHQFPFGLPSLLKRFKKFNETQ